MPQSFAAGADSELNLAVIYDGENAIHTPLNLWLSTGVSLITGFKTSGEAENSIDASA